MKRSNITAVLVLLASFLFVDIASGQLELRTWTSAGGKFSVDAQLEAVADGIVSLKRNDDGTTIKVELAKLCEADRKYVQSAIANQKARKPRHTVEGYMSIGIPEGYKWKVEREWEQNGVYSFLMVARNPNTLDFISLNVNFIAIEDNRIRKGKAESNFNSAVRSFKKMGYTNIKLRPPKIGNEVPDLVEAGLTAIDGDKDQAFIYFATKFEKYYTYAFQAHATTQASSKELAKFFSTLKEIEPKPKRHLDERLGVSIEIPKGFVVDNAPQGAMRLKAATGANIFIRKVPAKDGQDLDTISKIIFAQITQGQQAKKGKSGDTQLAGQAAKFLNYQDQIGQDSLQSKSWITARDESVFIISWTCLKADADETSKLLSAAVESIGFQ